MRLFTLLVVYLASVTAAPKASNGAQRIVGGTDTHINQWPQMANILFTWNWSTFQQYCGGTILNNRTILTAAHCIIDHSINRFRVRLGSTFASSGGVVRTVTSTILHPEYNSTTEDFDIALLRSEVVFDDQIQPAIIAHPDYELLDHEVVSAIGWGAQWHNGPRSEELRQVQILTINQTECERRYNTENIVITENMLCAGWLDVGGRSQCQGDNGGPLFHNGTVVGVYSFGLNCAIRFFPSVNVRVSRVSDWIVENQ